MDRLAALVAEIRACRACADTLPLGPRPVLHVSATARLLIASQAPGTLVHASGVSFQDKSGIRLRAWLGVNEATFYDTAQIALLPLAMCYPGRLRNGGDAPPPPICAQLWRARLLAELPDLRLTLLVGHHAQQHVLGPGRMTDRVRHYQDYLPRYLPLPHPSWRTTAWEEKNPWFQAALLPDLRCRLRQLGIAAAEG